MNKHRMNESTIFWRTYIKIRVREPPVLYMECVWVCLSLAPSLALALSRYVYSTDWATDFNLIVRRRRRCCPLSLLCLSVCLCALLLRFVYVQPELQSQARWLNRTHLLSLLRLYFPLLGACVFVWNIQYAEYVFTSSPFLSLLSSIHPTLCLSFSISGSLCRFIRTKYSRNSQIATNCWNTHICTPHSHSHSHAYSTEWSAREENTLFIHYIL